MNGWAFVIGMCFFGSALRAGLSEIAAAIRTLKVSKIDVTMPHEIRVTQAAQGERHGRA